MSGGIGGSPLVITLRQISAFPGQLKSPLLNKFFSCLRISLTAFLTSDESSMLRNWMTKCSIKSCQTIFGDVFVGTVDKSLAGKFKNATRKIVTSVSSTHFVKKIDVNYMIYYVATLVHIRPFVVHMSWKQHLKLFRLEQIPLQY